MRITTGKYKGRAIAMPKGIRPTQDKVRKAVFDILGDIEGLSFLELFAGSGAVGFEALSRGASELILAEYNRDCIAAIEKNIEALGLKNCHILPYEAAKVIERLSGTKKKFDIIFLDPPYYKDLATPNPIGRVGVPLSAAKKILQSLNSCDILALHGLIVVQHFKKDDLPEATGSLILCKQAKYGDTALSFYKKKGL